MEQAAQLGGALEAIAAEHARGDWHIALEEEDCHTAIEARLTQRLGELGRRIHLGRSRNDQVLAAPAPQYLLAVVDELHEQAGDVVEALDGFGAAPRRPACRGTHLQRAMPSTVELWAAAYASEIEDDRAGLLATRRGASRRTRWVPRQVRCARIETRSHARRKPWDSPKCRIRSPPCSSRAAKAEAQLVFELVLMQDIGAWPPICACSLAEFAFVKLPAAFTTGSSIMPQKRKSGRIQIAARPFEAIPRGPGGGSSRSPRR
ncbi:MAG: lyase family protein [Planctomycetota bacterium]